MIAGWALALVCAAGACGGLDGEDAASRIAGTWVLQQVTSRAELDRIAPRLLEPVLATPGVRGLCLRVPWRAIDGDLGVLEAGLAMAQRHGLAFSVRFMAGRHTPARVFEAGCRSYTTERGEEVPAPFLADGSPNATFEREYEALVARLAKWCRERDVPLLHLAWYGQEWAELNHGREVRALEGYTYERWLTAHKRLIDIGLRHAGDELAVEFPLSGHGPLTEAASDLAHHIIERVGPDSPRILVQANGWGPNGEWGAPNAATEAAFDRVWALPVRRGLQMIQPRRYDWAACYERLRSVDATYAEVYAPSFTLEGRDELARQVAEFAGTAAPGGRPP